MDDTCVFCKIVSGEIPAQTVWEDDNFIAFLSNKPIKKGHTLVIPKKHVPYIFDMEDEHLGQLMIASKKVARTIKKALNPKHNKVGVMVSGVEVPHTHVHLITLDDEGDLDFSKARDVTDEELRNIKEEIQQNSDH